MLFIRFPVSLNSRYSFSLSAISASVREDMSSVSNRLSNSKRVWIWLDSEVRISFVISSVSSASEIFLISSCCWGRGVNTKRSATSDRWRTSITFLPSTTRLNSPCFDTCREKMTSSMVPWAMNRYTTTFFFWPKRYARKSA